MSIPIWVTDPTDNNNPFLAIKPPAIFVAVSDLQGTFPIWTASAGFWWSEDAINWSQGTVDGAITAQSPNLSIGAEVYANGTWMVNLFNSETSFISLYIISYDGKAWKTVYSTAAFGGDYFFDYVANQWVIGTNHGSPVFIPNPNPPESGDFPSNDPRQEDFFDTSTGPKKDPAQAGDPTKNTINSLPSGITAVRYLDTGGFHDTFFYTMDTITQEIIDSGSEWPAASWTQSLLFGPTTGASGNTVVSYAPHGIPPA